MSGNKAVELQIQMRQNAEDLQNFMKELNNWEGEIKKKDQQLRARNVSEPPKTLPPVRNKDYKKTKKSVKRQTNGLKEQKETQRIKSYDYQAWDKFDVDKSLEAMDAEESPVHSNESYSEGLQVDRDLALTEKEKGNAYFKEGEYEAAVECYSRGMQADGTNALLPANRAMAYLRLHRFSEAEQDCSAALALDASYAKAFARRATARAARGRIREAKEDFEQVLKLEPGNKQALSEIEKLSAEMRSSGLLAPEDNKQRRSIQSINKPEDLRSAKPLRRIDIQEVGAEISPSTSSPHPKIQKIEEISDAPVSRACVDSSADPESIPPPPSNAFQLEANLRKTSRHPQSTYRYLKQISPDAYLKIFQNSLEPDVLNHILKTFHSFFQREDATLLLAVLRSLASVRRFDMTVMFMSSAEKKLLQELFDWIHSAGLGDASVQDLQKKYGL